MSGPARASADRGPRSARQGGVYSLHTRGRRALCLGAVCLAGLLMAACMHTVLSEPAGFSGTPRSPAPASPSPPQLTGDPDRPYLLQTQPPYTVALDAGHGGFDTGAARLFHIVSAVQRNGACRHAHQRKHRAQHACPDAEPLRHRACDIRH